MTTAADWGTRVGDVWAAEWRRTDRGLADLSHHLDAAILDAASGATTVLDIGCGAGATAAALAAARPDLAITGIDLSSALLDIARPRVPGAYFRLADAAAVDLRPRPDLLVSRHGVMFFADPVGAFAHLRVMAAASATLVFSCFADRSANAVASALVADLGGPPPPSDVDYAPGPFGFASRDRTATILAAAGWCDPVAFRIDFDYVVGEGTDPIADAVSFLSSIGPLASLIAADPAGRRPLLSEALARYQVDDRVVLPASAWIWRATKGEA